MVRDFCFWVVWAARPVHIKKMESKDEQLLRAVFSCFQGHFFFFFFFFENTTASTLKSCIIFFKSCFFDIFLLFCNKTGFIGLHTFSNMNVLHKGLLLQDWVFRLDYVTNYSPLPPPGFQTFQRP